MYISSPMPGATNDITLSQTDWFLEDIMQTNPLYTDAQFELMTNDGPKIVKGVYLLADNGYLNVRTLVCPFLHPPRGSPAAVLGFGV
mmetsp:Transcript_39242/g.62839  ORF Transcript_39242/g.62839 Transcript_39242/m.62839 type:complete len:87 (+) Transcript_39242:207-467(+)